MLRPKDTADAQSDVPEHETGDTEIVSQREQLVEPAAEPPTSNGPNPALCMSC